MAKTTKTRRVIPAGRANNNGAATDTPLLVHVASMVFNTPLAIIPEKLEVILRSQDGQRFIQHPGAMLDFLESGALHSSSDPLYRRGVLGYFDDDDDGDDDDPADQVNGRTRSYQIVNGGIAVIPISGTLMDSGGWMSALSGCSSYEGIKSAVQMAMDEDTLVRGVLFKVNSPGGSTSGCFELCDLIHSYRGKKPMYAIAKHLAASAAYCLASSADRLYTTMTGGVGSVGVFSLHCDESGADKDAGLKYSYIKFGAKKTDGNPHEALSTGARADLQHEVDRQGHMFVERVARNRGVSSTQIMDTEASVFCGDRAVPLLADGVATYDEVLQTLSEKVLDGYSGNRVTMPAGNSGLRSAVHPSAPQQAQQDRLDTSQLAQAAAAQQIQGESGATMAQPNVNLSTAANPNQPGFVAKAKRTSFDAGMKACSACDGTGQDKDGDECDACHGSGQVEDKSAARSATNAPAALAPGQVVMIGGVAYQLAAVPSATSPAPQAPSPNPVSTAPQGGPTMDQLAQFQSEQTDINELCAIAGISAEDTLKYIQAHSAKTMTVADVRSKLKESRVAKSNANPVGSTLAAALGATASGNPVATIHTMYETTRANVGSNMKPSQILEMVIRKNPALYNAYHSQRETLSLIPSSAEAAQFLAEMRAVTFPSLGLSGIS